MVTVSCLYSTVQMITSLAMAKSIGQTAPPVEVNPELKIDGNSKAKIIASCNISVVRWCEHTLLGQVAQLNSTFSVH